MRVHSLLASAAVIAIVAATSSAHAQTQPAGADATPTDEIVVTGVRASLRSAQALKQNASTIVDSIVAQDIGKLPDVNVTEALQRISGVQVARDYGEGGGVAIRGLSQVETTLNGREAFTAGAGRTFNFEDIAAEMVAGIDVYKTSQANLIEGGIGGSIDVRTHKPFDFTGFTASGSLRARYNDLAEKTTPLGSALISDRWQTGIGEVGVLLAATYQDRKYRNDGNTTGAPSGRIDFGPVAGADPTKPIAAPNGTYDPIIVGERKRTGVNAVVQWRPTDNLEIYAEYDYAKFADVVDQHGINIPTNGLPPVPGSATVFDGTNILSSATYAYPIIPGQPQKLIPVTTFGVSRDVTDQENTYAIGGKWTHDRLTLSTDVSYIKSTNDLRYAELDAVAGATSVTQDLRTEIPSFQVNGVDLTNINNFNVGNLTLSENHYKGSQFAWTGNARYELDGPITSIQIGARYADRKAHFEPVRFFAAPPVATSASSVGSLYALTPTPDFFAKGNVEFFFPKNYIASISDGLRNNFDAIRQSLGFTNAPSINPLSIFDIGEKTWAGYAMANYDLNLGLRVDGNVGVRVVQTEDTLVGFVSTYTGTPPVFSGYSPLNVDNKYTDVLPSFNARVHLSDQLQARFAASKTVTRPDFNSLSPSVNLVPGQALASSGNPGLSPLKSDNLDASLEYYFSPTNSIYAAAFYRKVKGFLTTQQTTGVVFDGLSYTLTQPVNGGDGTIKGLEVGYQQFFDFLPGLLSGLGVQANYTYVDSESPSPVFGQTVPLPNLSRNSFNLVGIYEKGPVSFRVAYNHRSKYYTGLAFLAGGLGAVPNYRNGYGWLDASLSYNVNDHFAVTLEGSNLLRTKTQTYYSTTLSPNGWNIDDRQISLGVRANF